MGVQLQVSTQRRDSLIQTHLSKPGFTGLSNAPVDLQVLIPLAIKLLKTAVFQCTDVTVQMSHPFVDQRADPTLITHCLTNALQLLALCCVRSSDLEASYSLSVTCTALLGSAGD